MAKTVGKLTALQIGRKLKPKLYADGAGLYLQVTETGAKSWVYRFMIRGKARAMGLGSLSAVSLADMHAPPLWSSASYGNVAWTLSKREKRSAHKPR
jgi:hypothetical protein